MKSHTQLLGALQTYIDAYINHLDQCAGADCQTANVELRRIIAELEMLLAHPDQQADAERLTKQVQAQLTHLRFAIEREEPVRPTRPSAPKRTLRQAFQEYITQEIHYLTRTAGAAQRMQTNALLSDIIADLKSLALHPTDQQAIMLTADLEAKRAQLTNLDRPWQQLGQQREVG